MIITKKILDVRICDVEKDAENTQTYREFIEESMKEFGMDPVDLDKLTSRELTYHLNFLDELWNK